MNIKVCDRCGQAIIKDTVHFRINILKSNEGYLFKAPVQSIDLCKICMNEVLKYIAKVPKEDAE